MKKQWFFILVIFFFCNCSAQQSPDLKNTSYYSVSSNRWVAVIRLTQDSVFIFKMKNADTEDKRGYKIIGRKTRGDYVIVYITKESPKITGFSHKPLPSLSSLFGAFIFSLSKNKDELLVLQETNQRYESVDDVKNAIADLSFTDKYFHTWYAESRFTELLKYPDLINADKATVQKVIGNWVDELKQNSDKARNTHNGDIYGAGLGMDVLAKVLINNHLSPMADLTDLNNKTTEYNIHLPAIPQRSH